MTKARPRIGPGRALARRDARAGVTLIEVLVALAIFALIGMAGFSVLDQVVRVQVRTESRLDRLADIERGMYLLSLDFLQARGGGLAFDNGSISLRRSAGDADMAVRYELREGTLVRSVSGIGSGTDQTEQQPILSGVDAARWSFLDAEGNWGDEWPPAATGLPVRAGGAGASEFDSMGRQTRINPRAVALDLTLTGPGLAGNLRRVAILPEDIGR